MVAPLEARSAGGETGCLAFHSDVIPGMAACIPKSFTETPCRLHLKALGLIPALLYVLQCAKTHDAKMQSGEQHGVEFDGR